MKEIYQKCLVKSPGKWFVIDPSAWIPYVLMELVLKVWKTLCWTRRDRSLLLSEACFAQTLERNRSGSKNKACNFENRIAPRLRVRHFQRNLRVLITSVVGRRVASSGRFPGKRPSTYRVRNGWLYLCRVPVQHFPYAWSVAKAQWFDTTFKHREESCTTKEEYRKLFDNANLILNEW